MEVTDTVMFTEKTITHCHNTRSMSGHKRWPGTEVTPCQRFPFSGYVVWYHGWQYMTHQTQDGENNAGSTPVHYLRHRNNAETTPIQYPAPAGERR